MRLVTCLLALMACTSAARADDAILILDASKSMLGRVQGRTKVDIARSVVTDLLGQIPADRRLGFVAYGHRRATDCNDIEELVPISGDRARIKASLDALAFRGKTPLTAAVRFAAEKLRYTDNKATVILVSDGIESCQADPCAAGADLEKAGVDLTVHVVGFGLAKREAKALRCLADATGGKYFSANNAAELSRALAQTVAQRPLADDTPAGGSATLHAPASVPAGANFTVQWTGPANAGDVIEINNGRERVNAHGLWADAPRTLTLDAPAKVGKYELQYRLTAERRVLATQPLEVTEVTATLSAPASVPAGAIIPVQWTGPGNSGDMVVLYSGDRRIGGPYVTRDSDTVKLDAPAKTGTYEVRYELKGTRPLATRSVEITDVTATVHAPASVPAGARFPVQWTGPGYGGDSIKVYDGAESLGGPYLSRGSAAVLTAPARAGKYEVRYMLRGGTRALASQPIDVTPVSATLAAPGNIAAGTKFEVEWAGPGYDSDLISLYRDEHRVAEVAASQHSKAVLTAPDRLGAYELRYELKGRLSLARRAILVSAP